MFCCQTVPCVFCCIVHFMFMFMFMFMCHSSLHPPPTCHFHHHHLTVAPDPQCTRRPVSRKGRRRCSTEWAACPWAIVQTPTATMNSSPPTPSMLFAHWPRKFRWLATNDWTAPILGQSPCSCFPRSSLGISPNLIGPEKSETVNRGQWNKKDQMC